MIENIDDFGDFEFSRQAQKYLDRWCYFGGGSSTQSSQNQTQTNTTDPELKALLMNNYATAQGNAGALTPYTGQLTAGQNATQQQAQGVLTGIGTDQSGQTAINGAKNAVTGVLNSNIGTIAGTDLSQYMNPYTKDVINASINQNEQARQTANMNDNQKATAAGAFGGSRSGVANAVTNQLYDQNNQSNIAALNSANYTQAQGAANSDIQNRLAQAGLTMNAAGQIVSLNNAGLQDATTRAGILGSVGDINQQQAQAQDDSAYQEFLRQQGFGAQQQSILNAALGLLPNQQTVTTNGTGSSSTKSNPGFGGILSSLGSIASGAAMLSDERTKSDIQTIGHDARGRRWVSYRYNWEPAGTCHEGVIAQEVLKTDPDAVILGDDGFYRVQYHMLEGAN